MKRFAAFFARPCLFSDSLHCFPAHQAKVPPRPAGQEDMIALRLLP